LEWGDTAEEVFMRATPIVLAVATILIPGCDDQGPIDFLAGTYVLQTVNGSALPFLSAQQSYRDTVFGLPVDVVESDELLSDTLHFEDITYRQTSILRWTEVLTDVATGDTVDSTVTVRAVTQFGAWGRCRFAGADTTVTFRVKPAGNVWSASVTGNALAVTLSGVEYVYTRER
jgi:hypothetical protein